MSKSKQVKDYRNITLEEAGAWVKKNCIMDDVRKRLMSRSVAFVLASTLSQALRHIDGLINENQKLRNELLELKGGENGKSSI